MKKATPPTAEKRNQITLARWAADCAEHVLPLFEKARPKDARPRQAIAAARAWARGDITCGAARAAAVAAHAAARATEVESARAAARATGHAAGTAHMAGHAQHASAYAIRAVSYAASDAAAERERGWQKQHLPEPLRDQGFPPATKARRTPGRSVSTCSALGG